MYISLYGLVWRPHYRAKLSVRMDLTLFTFVHVGM